MSEQQTLIIRLRALNYAATLTRFNLFILLVGFVLLYVDQGQDLLLEIAQEDAYPALLGGGLLWAWSIWYWARVLLDIRFPNPPVTQAEMAWWRDHLPRLLGLAAFAALAWNLYRATGWDRHVTAVVILGIAFYLSVLFRRPLGRWLAGILNKEDPRASWAWMDPVDNSSEHVNERWQDDLWQAWRKPLVKLTMLLGLLMFLWGMFAPLSMGLTFNTLVLLFLWGATFLPGGSVITYTGSRNGYPLFAALILLAMIFSHFNDNHAIRKLDHATALTRPSVEQALAQWTQQHQCSATDCPPLVIVATAGGGIRAAYWTGTVLGDLDDELATEHRKALRDNLFAISGVSGGSVGATVYRAALEAGVPQGKLMDSVQQVLAQDFLTPLAAGMLYPDLLQRFMPVAMFEDRATVFEEGLETGFEDIIGKPTLSSSFIGLSAGDKPWPALFLNSTWSDNGRRIVAAGLDMSAEHPLYADLLDRLGYDMRLSTAAHNSARFPFASPPGSWQLALDAEQQKKFKREHMLQRLQDGGLFENYGAETALEVLHAARRYFKRNELLFDPLVILISSDPSLPKNIDTPPINKPISFGYEVFTTFRTYAATRVGRGGEAASRLKAWIHNPARFAYFRMCDDAGQDTPPLGWALSHDAQRSITSYLVGPDSGPMPECRPDNQAARATVLKALADR